jgi:hypothetical protein
MPHSTLPEHEGLPKKKTTKTLKSLAVHPRFKTSYITLSPADPWTSASHPPAFLYLYAER